MLKSYLGKVNRFQDTFMEFSCYELNLVLKIRAFTVLAAAAL